MSTFWGGGVLRAESSLRVHGHLCVLLLGHQGGQLSALTSLHFSVVCGLQGWRGEVVCVLGGVQVHTPASWGQALQTEEEWGPVVWLPMRAFGAGLMGRQGWFPR